jgi:hypothetical protein
MTLKRTGYHRNWNRERREERNAAKRDRYHARESLGLCPRCGALPWEGKLCHDCKVATRHKVVEEEAP